MKKTFEELSENEKQVLAVKTYDKGEETYYATEQYLISDEDDKVTGVVYEEFGEDTGFTSIKIEVMWNRQVGSERLYTLFIKDFTKNKSAHADFKSVHDVFDFMFEHMNFNFEEVDIYLLSEPFMKSKLEEGDFDKVYEEFLTRHKVNYTIEKLLNDFIPFNDLHDYVLEDVMENHTIEELYELFPCETEYSYGNGNVRSLV